MKKTVILDTNFLIAQFAQRIDVFGELGRLADEQGMVFEFVVPSTVLDELAAMAGGKGRHAAAAAGALEMLKRKVAAGVVKVVRTGASVDGWILKKAGTEAGKEKGIVVCTNDRRLRENLKRLGVKVIVVRGRRRLFYS